MRYTNNKFAHTRFWSFSARLFTGISAIVVIAVVSLTVYSLNQQHQNESHATASTTLSFSQSTVQISPGSPITLDVTMNPGSNSVSLVTLVIDYDSSAVTPDTTKGVVPNIQAFPSTLDGPTYNTCNGTQCTMSISLSVGSDPTKAIKSPITVATVNFTPVAQNGTTQLTFDNQTQVFSIAPGDQANENVLSTTTPATVIIGQGSSNSPTPFPQITDTPTPTQPQGQVSPTPQTTCIPRPPCLDTVPRCTMPEPANGWCPPNNITPTPSTAVVCKQRDNDDDKDVEIEITAARQHIDNVESQINNLVHHKKLSKQQKLAFAQKANSNLATTENNLQQAAKALNIDSSTTGGCVGNFDPNNPTVVNDCNHPIAVGTTQLETFWNTVVNKFQSLFGIVPPTQ